MGCKASLMVVVCVLAACGGGGEDKAAGSGAGSGGAQPAKPPPPPKVVCADLPGASRFGLQASKDGKTLYYIEEASTKLGEERVTSFNLHAFDVASRTAKLAVSNISTNAKVAPDGTIVFLRSASKPNFIGKRHRVLMVMPPGKEAIAITDEKQDVGQFEIDAAGGQIAFIAGDFFPDELWRAPLAGGKAEKVAKAFRMLAVLDKSEVLLGSIGGLVRQPLAGGEPVKLTESIDSYVMGVHGGHVFLKNKYTKSVASAPLADLTKKTKIELAAEELDLHVNGDQAHFIAQRQGAYEVYELGDPARPVLVARGVRLGSVVKLGERFATLAVIDTDADGELAAGDESDVCFAEPGPEPIDFPTRAVPKRFKDVAARLAPLAKEGPLAGAKMRFITGGATEYVELSIASGPTELEPLRDLAKQTQDKVTRLSGLAQLSVRIEVRDKGRRAISAWDSRAGAFLTSAGMGSAQLVDRRQYQAEVDPKISLLSSYENRDSDIVQVTCSGTIKNISGQELVNLEAECSNQMFDQERREKVKIKPAKIAPNATGTYTIKLGVADSSKPIELALFAGETRIAYLNAYVYKRDESVLALAEKVYDETKLAFWRMSQQVIGPSYLRKKVAMIYVRADRSLDQGTDEARTAAAAKALPAFASFTKTDKNFEGEPMLLILRNEGYKVGWTYAGGRLTEGEPKVD